MHVNVIIQKVLQDQILMIVIVAGKLIRRYLAGNVLNVIRILFLKRINVFVMSQLVSQILIMVVKTAGITTRLLIKERVSLVLQVLFSIMESVCAMSQLALFNLDFCVNCWLAGKEVKLSQCKPCSVGAIFILNQCTCDQVAGFAGSDPTACDKCWEKNMIVSNNQCVPCSSGAYFNQNICNCDQENGFAGVDPSQCSDCQSNSQFVINSECHTCEDQDNNSIFNGNNECTCTSKYILKDGICKKVVQLKNIAIIIALPICFIIIILAVIIIVLMKRKRDKEEDKLQNQTQAKHENNKQTKQQIIIQQYYYLFIILLINQLFQLMKTHTFYFIAFFEYYINDQQLIVFQFYFNIFISPPL
ncbi:Growth_factor receptor cysteine-rich domain superfamily [Hexamita inflata]|uniref:Growth factor receptor cysteine-rich domain superfamily n=1 Tax=Hexamita inflata TaxID=28002 RepID=A0AA86NHV6_9EUKA|nr:Growth factor receptor cysteine-rich domain superfamily [Hexamita inflata]